MTARPQSAQSPTGTLSGSLVESPDEHTLIPDLLRSAPHVRPVLDRYGLRGCGGRLGPYETLGFFARAHEVPIHRLLAELKAALRPSTESTAESAAKSAMSTQSTRPVLPTLPVLDNPQRHPGDTIYRPFFKAGIAVVLTLGAVWGAYLLIRIALTGDFAAAGLHDVNAHGHAQIFGWVGLFVMGFAYQAFPRFKHATLAWPRLAMATLGMMLAGIVVRSVAQPLAVMVPSAWWAAVAASAVEVAAIALFVTIIVETWRRSGRPLAFYDHYILAALGWFVVQAVYESVYLTATLSASGADLVSLVSTWQAPLRDVQIHGFALLMILGVSQRIFHHFYGLPKPNERLSRAMLAVLNAAVIGEVAGLILMRTAGHAWAALWYLSVLALAGAVAALVWNWRIFSVPQDRDRSLKFLRAAYIWLLVSLGMLVLLPVYQHGLLALLAPGSAAARLGFSHAFYGAIRHAITVGFVSLMIVGVAAKVVPTLNGIPSRRLSPLWAPFVLINLGCSLRVFGQTLTDFTAAAFPIAGVSGLLEVTGLALWGGHLWLIMSGRPRLRAEKSAAEAMLSPTPSGGEPIEAHHAVGAVLEAHPQLLDVFAAHGFTMLTNPQLRRTIARVVTIEQACRRTGIDPASFVHALNERRQDERDGHDGHCCPQCASERESSNARWPVTRIPPSQTDHEVKTMNGDASTISTYRPDHEVRTMSADARKVIVTENLCGVCDTPQIELHHQNFPELRITGATAEQAAERLADRLGANLEVVTDPSRREPVRLAAADVRAFLDREGAAHPARDL